MEQNVWQMELFTDSIFCWNGLSFDGMKKIVILASGSGSNAQKIIDYFRNRQEVVVSLIICNKDGAGVLGIARSEGIPTLVIERERFFRGDHYLKLLQSFSPNLIVLAGFLWKIPVEWVQEFPQRMINIHPALLPKFGGKGMYGQFVHEAVLAAGEKETGITIHYVDELYDHGAPLFQASCAVEEGDTPESIAKKVQQLEHRHFPMVIDQVLQEQKIVAQQTERSL